MSAAYRTRRTRLGIAFRMIRTNRSYVRYCAALMVVCVTSRGARRLFIPASLGGSNAASRLAAVGWKPKISFREGLKRTYQDFSENMAQSSRVVHAPTATR
jgi:nucleoside-diphosphate-sugar epimerase